MPNQKLIDPSLARHFIHHYQNLLVQVAKDTDLVNQPEAQQGAVYLLQAARNAVADAPELIDAAQTALQQQGRPAPPEIMQAVATLRVDRWVYLRDTTSYSVLLGVDDQTAAYGVKGLTTPLKELARGEAGAVISCGLLVYQGQVICDGLVGFIAWIGPNYCREFNALLSELRATGRFYRDRILPAPKPSARAAKSS